MSNEFLRDRVGKRLLGDNYNPDEWIPRQIWEGMTQARIPAAEEPKALTVEEMEVLRGVPGLSAFVIMDMPLEEKRERLERRLEELKPGERELVAVE